MFKTRRKNRRNRREPIPTRPFSAYESKLRHLKAVGPEEVKTGICESAIATDELALGVTSEYTMIPACDGAERGKVAGYNVLDYGKAKVYYPRISRYDYYNLVFSRLPECEGRLQTLLNHLSRVDDDVKAEFLRVRKTVLQDNGRRGPCMAISPRLPPAVDEEDFTEEDDLSPETLSLLRGEIPKPAGRGMRETCTLWQVLNQPEFARQYNIPFRVMETCKRMAVTKPLLAARTLQNTANKLQSDVFVRIRTAELADSIPQARRVISNFTRNYRSEEGVIEGSIIGSIYTAYGSDGPDGWYVSGPMKYAEQIRGLFWMVVLDGPLVPSFLFSIELVLLEIQISDGISADAPVIRYHDGEHAPPMPARGITMSVADKLSPSAKQTVLGLTDRILPVRYSDSDKQVASALRVTGKYSVVNMHVVENGRPILVDETPALCKVAVSKDIWAVENVGVSRPWKFRTAQVGESVFICYRTGGEVSTSELLKVVSVRGKSIVMTSDAGVSFGCSGGAILAVSDLALLGVHSCATAFNLLGYEFGQQELSEVLECDDITVSSDERLSPDAHATAVFKDLSDKGLAGYFKAGVDALVPVYVGEKQVGVAVNIGDRHTTTCDATLPLTYGSEKVRLVAQSELPGRVYSVRGLSSEDSPKYLRAAKLGETVFAVTKVSGQPVISLKSTIMHVHPDAASFVLRPLVGSEVSMVGALVMGLDGAVLGQMTNIAMHPSLGLGHMCWPLINPKPPEVETPRGLLEKKFEFLHVEAWPEALLQEIFTHSSVGEYADGHNFNVGQRPMASVGDNMIRWLLHRAFRDIAIPHSKWVSKSQEYVSNAKYAELAWEFDLVACLTMAPCDGLSRTSRVYSETFLALAGVVSTLESTRVFYKFCTACGVVPEFQFDDG